MTQRQKTADTNTQASAANASGGVVGQVDVQAAQTKVADALGSVEVMYGAESQELAIAGASVADVRSHLKHVLNIPADAQARVNGELKDGDYILQENDTLEFVKVAGQKGAVMEIEEGGDDDDDYAADDDDADDADDDTDDADDAD